MHTRTHDRLNVSVIGLGCYGLSGAYGPPDVAGYVRTLRRGHELGVTFYDTAPAYGDAERVLGDAVAPFRDEVVLATKIGMKQGARSSLAPDDIRASCEASLRRLRTDRIDLFQIHFDDPATPAADVIGALDELKQAGKILCYGLGHLSPERAVAFLTQGTVATILLELSAVAVESRNTLLPLCTRYGAAAIAFSVTGRGLLTGAYGPGHRFTSEDIRALDPLFQRERFASGLRVAARLSEIGSRYGRTAAQVAIAWVLAQSHVLCALTGPSKVAHLEENLAAADWLFPPEELAALDAELEAERRGMAEAQVASVRHILTHPLPAEPVAAFVDLVYALETALQLGWVSEEQILPTFQALFELRGCADPEALVHIQEEAREIQVPDGGPPLWLMGREPESGSTG
jgi:aryl-alcohol dehydrogenase-like predicted oxidoreductase